MSTAANTDLGPTPSGGDSGEARSQTQEREVLDQRIGLMVSDRYKIMRTLGSGGMGGVYEAVHEGIGRKVAIKCLHAEFARDRGAVERFRREARAATAIGNEHIVDVTDVGELPDGAPFLVMELLAGQTLGEMLRASGALRVPRAVHIAVQVCDALEAAHGKGIIHRDLKPDNIFITKRGGDPDFVKVLDFGISKAQTGESGLSELTRTGMAIGTPSYMSPEQAQGLRDVDGRTDIWALGVILYEMLSEHRPFVADTYPRLLMHIVGGTPHRVSHWRRDIPDELDALIMRCLEKDPTQRVPSMAELAKELGAFASVDSVPEIAAADASGAPVGAEKSSEGKAARRGGSQPEIPRAGSTPGSSGADTTARQGAQAAPSGEAEAIVAKATSSRTPMIVGGLVVVALVAMLGAWGMGGGRPSEPVDPPATSQIPVTTTGSGTSDPIVEPPATVVAPTVVAPTVVPPAPVEVHHRIESRPPGATVLRGETELGTTPLEVSFPQGEAVELTLRLSGRRPATHVIAADDPETITVTLEPRRGTTSALPQLADH